ncbi:hypothetical protein D3C80_1236940 [compost metagenome]
MQGGVVARVVGEHGNGEHPVGSGGQGNAVARLDLTRSGNVFDLLHAHLGRCGHVRHHVVPAVLGVCTGLWHRRVFHGPGHGLAVCAVQLTRLLVRLGHVVPHGCREAVPQISVLLAPQAGPGHAADQHQQQQGRTPETGYRVQVTPEQPAARRQPRPKHASATAPARPPQVQARYHQHDAPARSQFHQPVTDRADHQLAMQGAGDGLQVLLAVLFAEDLAAVWVDEHVQFAPAVMHHELRTALGVQWRQVLGDVALWVGLAHFSQHRVCALPVLAGLDHHQVAVQQRVELGLEQIDDPGDCQQDHERGHEQPRIKMPTPGQVIERDACSSHGNLLF